ncbi:PEPxxWA-CTERM sorting domain-containing protein [Altererythrobacter aurantiacus]|uniref:PEPxxWA-CTERM sorting domain-containing protein n=1 Tax=Parapontixanthobacter aurantiacus TaxID=1463599 RepID=A0A844ZF13_9SPHN|nr:PEPxxWA-CTERM sorting domain-containing protein [Parapontixanthobacter aurantiacus]MXO85822.1 PEPxxWA-CTERM sorting domain-containing protein [Parapontixanthobacter aurantiacus]
MKSLKILAVPALLAATGLASAASAATIIDCTGTSCVNTDENVILNDGTDQTVVTGETNQSATGVTFTSSTDLLDVNNGQSSLTATDGLLNSLSFQLEDGATFQTASFNLAPLTGNNANEATSVIFTFSTGEMQEFALSGNGNNFFGVTADPGEALTGISFTTLPGGNGIDSFRQLRLGGIATTPTGAVPEPSTWALMLLGFGFVGGAMRARKQKQPVVKFA